MLTNWPRSSSDRTHVCWCGSQKLGVPTGYGRYQKCSGTACLRSFASPWRHSTTSSLGEVQYCRYMQSTQSMSMSVLLLVIEKIGLKKYVSTALGLPVLFNRFRITAPIICHWSSSIENTKRGFIRMSPESQLRTVKSSWSLFRSRCELNDLTDSDISHGFALRVLVISCLRPSWTARSQSKMSLSERRVYGALEIASFKTLVSSLGSLLAPLFSYV